MGQQLMEMTLADKQNRITYFALNFLDSTKSIRLQRLAKPVNSSVLDGSQGKVSMISWAIELLGNV